MENITEFKKSFYQSLGSSYKNFYSKKELDSLIQELYSYYNLHSRISELDIRIIPPYPQDPLLRINLYQIIIICNSMPFFTSKLRKTFYVHEIDVNRNIHFHPDNGKEMYYIELEEKHKDFIQNLESELQKDYSEIITLTTSYRSFNLDTKANWLNCWGKEYNQLLKWLLHEGYVWEGAYIIDFYDNETCCYEALSYGNSGMHSEAIDWALELPDSNKPMYYVKESITESFLGDGEYLYFTFIHKKDRMLLVGSLSQKAVHTSIGDIPVLSNRFSELLKEQGIESFSGLGRTLRMMFNYIPSELLFILRKENFSELYKSFIERSLKYSLGASGFLLNDSQILFIIFIPEKNWTEEGSKRARDLVSQLIPNSVVKYYSVLRGSIIQEFLLIDSKGVDKIEVMDITSRLEILYRTWEEDFYNFWIDRNKDSFPQVNFRKDYKTVHSPYNAVIDVEEIPMLKNNISIKLVEHDTETTAIYAITPDMEYSLSLWVRAISDFGLSAISQRVYRFLYNETMYAKSEFFFEKLNNTNNLYKRISDGIYYTIIGKLPSDPLSTILPITNIDVDGLLFLKAMRDYCRQTRPSFNKLEFSDVLLNYPEFCSALWSYFYKKFKEGIVENENELKELSDKASTLKEDEVLNAMRTATLSILRTDFFGLGSKESEPKIGIRRNSITFKIDSSIPSTLSNPRPFREIFVYSANFQGVHLRGGLVARGGLRFSDRPNDYRTEVLSLLKTQMVKNSLIVPVGSKGCFVTTKNPYSKKETTLQEAYIGYVSSLVSLTDNRAKGEIVPYSEEKGPFSYDDLDPYLVVAADKGTANMSDTANSISKNYNFWLDDAFASGGSKGYSHKEYGITAKGALVTADRHLRNCKIDFRTEPISVVAIGDMGGDVFGNGLLESQYYKLVAAFNHKHIFLDPNPDPQQSYEERKRLFFSKDSGWDFYNKELISKGGGVYLKTEKSIPISKEIQEVLDIEASSLSGNDLIKAILKAPVDLFYNGGIGTYIKAEYESNTEVGDPVNNELRINGSELRAKVVSEGGNLGFTQAGRIEFDQKGGLIYTDALDNSGGVDLSDHEVNLKLLCSTLIDKALMNSKEDRDQLLKEIATDVVSKVLRNNALQSLAINVDHYESFEYGWKSILKSVEYLIAKKLLVPSTEGIPLTNSEWDKWKEKSPYIPRPALCVLLGYVKMDLYTLCLKEKLFEPTTFKNIYLDYFPSSLYEKFGDSLFEHPLAFEISTTVVVNFLVNLLGISSILIISNEETDFSLLFKIVHSLYENGYYELLNELSLLRDKEAEEGLSSSISSIRKVIRNKYIESQLSKSFLPDSIYSQLSESSKLVLKKL